MEEVLTCICGHQRWTILSSTLFRCEKCHTQYVLTPGDAHELNERIKAFDGPCPQEPNKT